MKKRWWFFPLALLFFAIPIEHKYDKLFRFYSLTLIPEGLTVPPIYDPKIYFYPTDLLSLLLALYALAKIPWRRFFSSSPLLYTIVACAALSVAASPFATYPLPYIRLLHLLSPILLFSFLTTFVKKEELPDASRLIFSALFAAALLQSGIAIAQYFEQSSLGLRLLSEPKLGPGLPGTATFHLANGHRWLFDAFFPRENPFPLILRASGTLPHPNVLGGFLAITLLFSYPFALKRRALLASLPLLFFALALTYSRAALFAWALGTALFFLFQWRKMRLLPLAVTLLATLAATFTLLGEQYLSRGGVFNYNPTAHGADTERLFYQNIALKMIEQNPLTGVGFTQFSLRSPDYLPPGVDPSSAVSGAHNIYLFLATETGLLSLASLLLFSALVSLAFLRSPKDPLATSLFSAFAALLFIGGCDFYPILFQQGKFLFFPIAALLAAHTRKEKAPPSPFESWKLFDLISPTYDKTNRLLSFGMDRRWRARLAHHLPQNAPLTLLDLATGTGDQLLPLLQKCPLITSATGIDLSEKMLALGAKKLAPFAPKVALLKADAEALPFPEATFDLSTFSFGIRNVPHPTRSLQEIHRVLKPKGRCLILEFSLPQNRLIRPLYLLYLRHLLPLLGGLVSRKFSAYRYLNETIEHFPCHDAFAALMREAHFQNVRQESMAFGAVTLYIGEK